MLNLNLTGLYVIDNRQSPGVRIVVISNVGVERGRRWLSATLLGGDGALVDMEKLNKISVYIPTLNADRYLENTLRSLASQRSLINEILIIDGRSTDQTCEIARDFGAIVINNPRRHAAAARRLAFEKATSEYVACLDADCEAPPDWLNKIANHFLDPDLDGVGGPCISSPPINIIEEISARAFENIMQFPTQQTYVTSIGMRGTFIEANCAYRKQAVLDIGNYDIRFKNHAEGVDLFWRLVRGKYRLLFDPMLTVVHTGYAKNLRDLVRRNYGYGWSSTKLANYSLKKNRIDTAMWRKIGTCIVDILRMPANENRSRELFSLIQYSSFMIGKIFSSICLRHINF